MHSFIPSNAQTTLVSAAKIAEIFPVYDASKHVVMSATRPLIGAHTVLNSEHFIHGRCFALVEIGLAEEAAIRENLLLDGTVLLPLSDKELAYVFVAGSPEQFKKQASEKLAKLLGDGLSYTEICQDRFISNAIDKWSRRPYEECVNLISEIARIA